MTISNLLLSSSCIMLDEFPKRLLDLPVLECLRIAAHAFQPPFVRSCDFFALEATVDKPSGSNVNHTGKLEFYSRIWG